ncbi:MAG: hypothetical protein HY652_07745 [Acidobacteria bacterium]|nr:hypothetical protein [Acidobacteriota bacterium]
MEENTLEKIRREFEEGCRRLEQELQQLRRGVEEAFKAQGAPAGPMVGGVLPTLRAAATQAELLQALMEHSAPYAGRLALFLEREDDYLVYSATGFAPAQVRNLATLKSKDSILKVAAEQRATAVGSPDSPVGNAELLARLGGPAPARVVAIPLVIRDRVPAILYADGEGNIALDALEILCQHTSLALENVALALRCKALSERAAAAPPQEVPAQPAQAPAGPVRRTEIEAPPVALESEPATSRFEGFQASSALDLHPGSTSEQLLESLEREVASLERDKTPLFSSEGTPEPASWTTPEPPAPPTTLERAPVEPRPAPRPEPPPPPQILSPAEEKLHADARRFARLLVAEIKLYNEQKVEEGRRKADLYERLKRDIDRSRDMYERRVDATVAKQVDYFYSELVRILADNDAAALGADYPGPLVRR